MKKEINGILAPIGSVNLDTGEILVVYRDTTNGGIVGLDASWVEGMEEDETVSCPYSGGDLLIDESLSGDFGYVRTPIVYV